MSSHANGMLGASDLPVPRLGVGTMTWGDPSGLARWTPAKLAYGGPSSRDDEEQAFRASLQGGATFFDTAAMYSRGASERRLGELASGTSATIATKFPPGMFSSTDDLTRALAASLVRLRRDSIDLYQHHFPSRRVDIPRLMDLMADAVEAGKVKAVGVSNYSAAQVRTAHAALAARGVPLASNQVQYSLLHRQPETDGVLDVCRELGVTLIAYMPLASGALTGKYSRSRRPWGMRRFTSILRRRNAEAFAPVLDLLTEIGSRHGKTPAQVALRWLLEHELVLPIAGAKNAAQASSNAAALTFALDAAEVEALDRATRAWRE
jgi:aryl-alcohol dehydrogenase-like predicted oxidoreductase